MSFSRRTALDMTASNGDLSVGVKILDCDHREMVEAIYKIQRALTAGEDAAPDRLAAEQIGELLPDPLRA